MKLFLLKWFRTKRHLKAQKNVFSFLTGESGSTHDNELSFDSLSRKAKSFQIYNGYLVRHMFNFMKKFEMRIKDVSKFTSNLPAGLTGIKIVNPSEGDFSKLNKDFFVHSLQMNDSEHDDDFHLSEVLTDISIYEQQDSFMLESKYMQSSRVSLT